MNNDEPTTIVCPICEQTTEVYHFQWEAITCQTCGSMVDRRRWTLWQDEEENDLPF